MFFPIRLRISILLTWLFCLHGYNQTCTLTGFLDQGVANSPALKDLSNQIRSNQYDSLIARATYLPQVNFNGYAMYAPSVNGWGYSDVITNGQQLTGTFNVNHQIFNKKTKEATYQKYGLESGSLANNLEISASELKKAITAQYLAAFAAQEERDFQRELLVTLQNEAGILKVWTEKGIYRQTDYLLFKIELMDLERNIRDLDLQYRKESWNLNLICGSNDTAMCHLMLPEFKNMTVKTAGNSLFFKQFRIDSLLITNERLLIDRRYQPVVGWFADGGFVNNEPRYLYQNFGISAGLSLTLPVFDGNQRKINYEKLRVHEETRKNFEENFRFRYRTQLKNLQDELERTRLSLDENNKQVGMIMELVEADKVLLKIGSAPVITDYLLALKNLIGAKHAGLLYRIRTQYILNEINFWIQ